MTEEEMEIIKELQKAMTLSAQAFNTGIVLFVEASDPKREDETRTRETLFTAVNMLVESLYAKEDSPITHSGSSARN